MSPPLSEDPNLIPTPYFVHDGSTLVILLHKLYFSLQPDHTNSNTRSKVYSINGKMKSWDYWLIEEKWNNNYAIELPDLHSFPLICIRCLVPG